MNKFIKDNLDHLCECTKVTTNLLARLITLGVIQDDLVEEIRREYGNLGKALVLYSHMQASVLETKYPDIKTALDGSANHRALKFFVDNFENDLNSAGDSATTSGSAQQTSFSTVLVAAASSSQSMPAAFFNTDEKYDQIRIKRALIINITRNRRGAEFDTPKLYDVLVGCGFYVEECLVLTEMGILRTITNFRRIAKDADCILVSIMSHGRASTEFITEDGLYLDVDKDVVRQFNNKNSPELQGKPKIFLFNFCRGSKLLHQDTIPQQDTDGPVVYGDILKCFSTYDEHVSVRDSDGTWFVQGFCEVVQSNCDGTRDFKLIMDNVYTAVTKKSTGYSQSPTYESTGFKQLYLKYSGQILCQYAGCDYITLPDNYAQHLRSMHDLSEIQENGFMKCWTFNLEQANLIPPTIIKEFGETFVFNLARPHQNNTFYYVWVNVLGSAETAKKFEFQFMILKSDNPSDAFVNQVLPVLAIQDANLATIPGKDAGAIRSNPLGTTYCQHKVNTNRSGLSSAFKTKVTIIRK